MSLLNLGEEKTKGNMLTQATYNMMENNSDYNFIGNIEGRDIFGERSINRSGCPCLYRIPDYKKQR